MQKVGPQSLGATFFIPIFETEIGPIWGDTYSEIFIRLRPQAQQLYATVPAGTPILHL